MQPHMVSIVVYLTTNCSIRRVRISVPLVECLVDGVRYFREGDLPPPSGDDLRPLYRPRLTSAADRRSPHRDATLGQDAGNARRACADPAVKGRGVPAALSQHPAHGNAAGDGHRPGGEAVPLALTDPL